MKILLLNGPPGSGKDYLASKLAEKLEVPLVVDKLAKTLKTVANNLIAEMTYQRKEYCEGEIKDERISFCGNSFTPRELLITLSEDWMKPRFGNDIHAEILINRIYNIREIRKHKLTIISDLGFPIEYETFITEFGQQNVAVIHLSRPGTSFKNDSRNYVDFGHNYGVRLISDSTLVDKTVSFLADIWPDVDWTLREGV